MNPETPKPSRLRLETEMYATLRLRILKRDGWRCQLCGRRDQLEVHHIVHRSQSGADCQENLITLCGDCHRSVHTEAVDE